MPDDAPIPHHGTDLTRFNALRHGILSRHTVLPYENANEYVALLEALVSEHQPNGPTEEHSCTLQSNNNTAHKHLSFRGRDTEGRLKLVVT